MPRVAARRILLLALAVGVVVDIRVPGHAAGVNAVRRDGRAPRRGLSWRPAATACGGWTPPTRGCPSAAIWLAAMAVIRADSWLVQADLLLAAALAGGTIAAPRRGADHPWPRAPRPRRRRRGRRGDAHGRDRGGRGRSAAARRRRRHRGAGRRRDARLRDRLRPWLPVVPGPPDRDADPARCSRSCSPPPTRSSPALARDALDLAISTSTSRTSPSARSSCSSSPGPRPACSRSAPAACRC